MTARDRLAAHPGLTRDAWERAQAVVGLYGGRNVSWSILLQAALTEPLRPREVQARLADLAGRHWHLGGPPVVESVPSVEAVRATFASTPYDGRAPLVRVALANSPPGLLLAAHHGAVDGLGLLALLGTATGQPVSSDAVGVAHRPAAHTFAGTAVRRLAEALFAPPTRLRPAPGPADADPADVLRAADLPRERVGTAVATAAALAVAREWNRSSGERCARIVAAIGASLRGGADVLPEHRAAYLRLPLPYDADPARVRHLLDRQPPEPTFPPSRSRVASFASRTLAGRLGATFLVSNLGAVQAGRSVRSLAFFPQGTGRAGVAFGVVSTATATTLTVRARASEFTGHAAEDLLARFSTAVADAIRPAGRD